MQKQISGISSNNLRYSDKHFVKKLNIKITFLFFNTQRKMPQDTFFLQLGNIEKLHRRRIERLIKPLSHFQTGTKKKKKVQKAIE